ncbi:MAG: FAD-binding oxidoreductase, partial [Bacteroidota bacterium]
VPQALWMNGRQASLRCHPQYLFHGTAAQRIAQHGVPLRARAFANINRLNKLGSILPKLSNFMLSNALSGGAVKKILGVAPQRSLPTIHPQSLRDWYRNWKNDNDTLTSSAKTVYFFCDEFTDYNDTPIGSKAIELLTRLGYQVEMIEHEESGRAAMSKGLLDIAQQYARTNVAIFSNYITAETPLIGIEPSAILSFRDEYLRLVDADQLAAAKALSNNVFTIDEFLAAEIKAGRIEATHFTKVAKKIKLHGHCHQKALSSIDATAWMLSLPENYEVELIPSGCCGMAGSFGYEAEHYELSMQIGELVLFPAVRESAADIIIAAPGTSCRHQIKDGTERKALHPVEILYEALV